VRVVSCPSHPWWIAQHRAGLYRESRAVQPSSAQVRVSPKARTIGSAPAARRRPLRLSTTMLGLFPHPSRANSSRPRHSPPVGLAVVASGRLPPAGSSSSVVLVDTVGAGLAGRGTKGSAPPGRRVVGGRAGLAPPDQPRSAGRSRGAGAHASPRSAAVDPGPGGRLDAGELFAWVGGSSVSLTCSCADQGGCHVDMVVGADHRGRCRVGVRRDAEPSPLTARRHQPDHGWRSCSTRPTTWRRGRCPQAQRAQPTT
jgi:hypothetical protein